MGFLKTLLTGKEESDEEKKQNEKAADKNAGRRADGGAKGPRKGDRPERPARDGKAEGRNYLFFENNLTDTERYAKLEKYDGRYSYNGSVSENEDGSYSLIPAKLTVDDVLSELESYVEYVMGGDTVISSIVDSTPISTAPPSITISIFPFRS